MRATLLLSLPLLALFGCPSQSYTFSGPGFAHPVYSYVIEPEGDGLLSSDWQLLNYEWSGDEYVQKQNDRYFETMAIDFDDDGIVDWRGPVATHDLVFRHRRNAARITVRSLPLNERDQDTLPRVLAKMVLQGSAGSDLMLYSNEHGIGSRERSYAPRLLSEAPVAVAGRAAWEMTYDLVSLERQQVDDSAVWKREVVVLVRTGLPFPVTDVSALRTLPTVLMFTLSAFPEDFPVMVAELRGLIDRLRFHDSVDPSTREAVLACTGADVVGIVKSSMRVAVPALSEEEADCVREALPDLEPGAYSFGRDYQPPPPAPVPATDRAGTGPESAEDGAGAAAAASEEARTPPLSTNPFE